ncbi:hypothetical protein CRV24_008664 [Beauveria bassiana]|nr:hypothetical protein CRV24_008664 [Beauveria bassiana]KAH8715387.1 hypothetical protein HC256_004213 [Beauveria bassiana]
MDVDDVYLVLHHHWVHDTSAFPDERQRIQLALMILVQAYTATRPRVLAYKKLSKEAIYGHYFGSDEEGQLKYAEEWGPKEDDFKTICYRDVKLVLLTRWWQRSAGHGSDPEVHQRLGTKGEPVSLLDNAFAAELRSVEDFYKIRVRAPRRSLEFDWKDGIKDTPIFRQALVTHEETIQTSPTEAIHYHTYLYYLQRLGLMTGFMQILNPYCIRRGSGEAVEAVGTQAQLQQVMQHIDAATYQAYINQRVQCDTVAAFLGRPSNNALLKAAGHMSRSVDPRAPTQASTP